MQYSSKLGCQHVVCRSDLATRFPSLQFDFFKKKAVTAAPVLPTIVPEPSYNIPAVLLATSALSASQGAVPVAALTGVLGAFLAFQVCHRQICPGWLVLVCRTVLESVPGYSLL